MEKRNIVLITLDSLRADHCSFMGYKRKTTPFIDKLAKKGAYFQNAIAATLATPLSMSSIFTGEYPPISNGTLDPRPWREFIKNKQTLPEILSQKGYSTIGITPNVYVSHYYGFDKGFKYFHDFLNEKTSRGLYSKILQKAFKSNRQGIFATLRNLKNFLLKGEIFKPWESYYNLILEYIEKANKPIFLWILLLDTHYPYLPPRKFRKYSSLFGALYSNWKVRKVDWRDRLSNTERNWLIDSYDDSITYADSFVKKLWNDLKDLDPIFIIHADHGEAFGEHGVYGHDYVSLYEEHIHIPLVIYNADIKGKFENPVSLISLGSTILELIGEENQFPHSSIFRSNQEWTISYVRGVGTAIRLKDWKFITGQKQEDELYNLKEDPYEKENLIDEHPKLAKELKTIAEKHMKHEEEKLRISKISKKLAN
ncbi:sulfatase [Thermococcus sp. SY098]|uniref:sulfatase n=1 Tax=Thermococcus sp. SY098 TaxID=3111325 RepID=UPI002D76E38A|nr:sulfatase [Thermococcus sp. SY098]WRS52139.1 sulfatase [Thermococcus sp. SY098]